MIKDLPEITANLSQMVIPIKQRSGEEKETQRQVERKIVIVKEIDKKCIVHIMELTRAIMQEEASVGSHETICRKSLMRLLHKMQQANVLNFYEVTLQYGERLRLYRMVSHPKINIEHQLLQREVLRLKSNLHLTVEERPLRSMQEIQNKKRKELIAHKQKQLIEKKITQGTKPSVPKLLLACTLHEFLFFLLVEQKRDQAPLEMNTELLQLWQRTEPSLQTRQFLEEWQAEESPSLPYMEDISWRTFIPPLPKYEDKPAGWLYFMDVVSRMPLSLIMRMFRIERDSMDQLRSQLQHPVRQHYLMHQLQLENLIPRLRLQQLYQNTLRLLNNMGLVQVSEAQLGRDGLQRWVYLNRRSCLLDTTTSSGHNYNRISAERQYEELHFEFETRQEITDYWAKLQHICIYTKLGFLKHRDRRKTEPRLPPLDFVRICTDFEEAVPFDDGTVPGDRQGAAGLSSKLYAHQFRHWSWVKRTVKSAGTGSAVGAIPATKRKRRSVVRVKSVAKMQIRKTRGPISAAQLDVRKRKGGPRDDIDRDALRNMRNLRVTWTAAEDRLLKMGRAVYMFIDAPLPALALFNVGTICRDVIRHYLGICNKTTQACVRRMQFLIRMKRDLPDVPNWIYTMQTQPEINNVYNERFLTELKETYPSRSEFNEALLIHFILILSKLHHLVNSAASLRFIPLVSPLLMSLIPIEHCATSVYTARQLGGVPATLQGMPSPEWGHGSVALRQSQYRDGAAGDRCHGGTAQYTMLCQGQDALQSAGLRDLQTLLRGCVECGLQQGQGRLSGGRHQASQHTGRQSSDFWASTLAQLQVQVKIKLPEARSRAVRCVLCFRAPLPGAAGNCQCAAHFPELCSAAADG